MNCKDCIHGDVCEYTNDFSKCTNCTFFKDKALFLSLPCKLGDTLYDASEFFADVKCSELYELNVNDVTVIKSCNNRNAIAFIICDVCFESSDFGRTVFFSKLDAEAAIRRFQKNKEGVE